jgi:hypothetical protein
LCQSSYPLRVIPEHWVSPELLPGNCAFDELADDSPHSLGMDRLSIRIDIGLVSYAVNHAHAFVGVVVALSLGNAE